jgi:hypothetical protein
LSFIVLHLTFVFTTGLLVNLNHVYARHRQVVADVFGRVGVVVDALVGSVAERVDDDPLRLGIGRLSS